MIRRTISLVLALSLAVLLIGLDPNFVSSAPTNGDVDPTGLDNGHRLTSVIPDHDVSVVGLRDVAKSGSEAVRWIEMFYLRMLLRSLGF